MGMLYEVLRDHVQQEQGVALATVVRGAGEVAMGARLLVFGDRSMRGTLGDATLDAQVLDDAERFLWKGEARTLTYMLAGAEVQEVEVFIEGFPPPPTLIIVGAGHIAIPLTIFAKTLHYHVIIIDARSAFATRERFPMADELIVAWPDEVLAHMHLNPSSAVAVLTHDPKFDEPSLKVILSRNVGYVGAIGSRKTGQERAERLRQQGLTDEQLARIHGPIGLNIGASDPTEIALAIMAEIVAVRHGKDQRTLLV